jgi:hypothetical protein
MNLEERQKFVKHEITKEGETFDEVKFHINNKLMTTAVSRIYMCKDYDCMGRPSINYPSSAVFFLAFINFISV